MGPGTGVMLTSSVNVVQSSFPDRDQGDISGQSRSVSNLGSSLGPVVPEARTTSLPPLRHISDPRSGPGFECWLSSPPRGHEEWAG
jgi:hypothetical protein